MKRKYILIFILGILFISIGSLFIINHKQNQNWINSCLNANNEEKIFHCSEFNNNNYLSHQQLFDIFYKNASKYHDDKFYGYFSDAYNHCIAHPNECSTHDENVFIQLANECAKDNNISCSVHQLAGVPNVNKIKLFINTMIKNKTNNEYPCIDGYNEFYQKLTTEQKSELDPDLIKDCEYYSKTN